MQLVWLLSKPPSVPLLIRSSRTRDARQRDLRLDTLRGLLLVLITINHFGGWSSEDWWVRHFTWQPFGYVSAAEGFVFLSGFVFARVYARYADHPAVLWQVARQRAFTIYAYHLAMLLGLVAAFLFVPRYHAMWQEWFSPHHLTPVTSTLAATLLLHQPPYLDILPMYAEFVLLSPLVLSLLHHHHEGALIIGSLLLWLLGQYLHFGETVTTLLAPGHHPGHFNLLAWQLLYVFGLLWGKNTQKDKPISLLMCKPLMRLVFLCAFGLFLSRHTLVFPEIVDGIDRASLGWLRVVNCFLLIALISARLQQLPSHAQVSWLAFLGQHPLPVFSFHSVMLYLLMPITSLIAATLGSTGLLSFMILVVFCLRLPALFHRKYATGPVPINKSDPLLDQRALLNQGQ